LLLQVAVQARREHLHHTTCTCPTSTCTHLYQIALTCPGASVRR
jgi:hypothetical protein